MAIDKYTLKDGTTRYRASTYIDGVRVQKRGFKTKREAQKWIEHSRVDGSVPSNVTIKQLSTMWLEQYRPTVKPSTYGKTKTIIDHINDEWGNRIARTITPADAQTMANKWSYEYVKYDKMICYAKALFTFAIRCDLLRKNPFDGLKTPKRHKAGKEKEMWTLEQLETFLEACKTDQNAMAYPLFRLMAYTGIRRGEAIALEWSDLDGNLLTISKAITVDYDNHYVLGDPKNKSSNRVIGLDPGTVDALEKWHELSTANRIFPININRPGRWMKKIAEQAGLPPSSPHMLRHLHCTIAIQSGANIRDVQERLGHSDIETTLKIYTDVNKNKTVVAGIFAQTLSNHYTAATREGAITHG